MGYKSFLFYLACLVILSARMVFAVDVSTDTIISTDTTATQTISEDNVTLTNNANLSGSSGTIIQLGGTTGTTIINNAGATISSNTQVIRCTTACTNATIINSGTIKVTTTSGGLIRFDGGTGALIINNPGGLITGVGNEGNGHHAVDLGGGGTLINRGTIIRTKDGVAGNNRLHASIAITSADSVVILKDDSILVGILNNFLNRTGVELRVDHGYGRSYFYNTVGTFELSDLSGNRIVEGSATAVGMGAQETVDELLGLRAYNLRATLKRYADAPNPKATIEPFAYASHRDRGRTTLRYENYAAGTNFIYPVVPDKLNLILTLERNKLNLDEDHDITKNSFLIGVNTNDFMEIGAWKASGFAAGGVSWHDSDREVLTNTVITGIADVTAEYDTTEAITGLSFIHTYDQKVNGSVNNTWDTDLGLTFSFSHTPSYSESLFFTWEERNLAQVSIHIGEQLTSMLGDKLQFRLGGEFEHRSVFAGKNQNHALNSVAVDFRSGAFYENSVSMNTGFDYLLGDYSKAYVRFNGRVSDQAAFTIAGSVGLEVIF